MATLPGKPLKLGRWHVYIFKILTKFYEVLGIHMALSAPLELRFSTLFSISLTITRKGKFLFLFLSLAASSVLWRASTQKQGAMLYLVTERDIVTEKNLKTKIWDQVLRVICHMLCVTCQMSLTRDPPPTKSPSIHSRLLLLILAYTHQQCVTKT